MEENNTVQKIDNLLIDMEKTIEEGTPCNELCNELAKLLTQYIYDCGSNDILRQLRDKYEKFFYWEQIEKRVRHKTDLFVRTAVIREREVSVVCEAIDCAFKNRYIDHETPQYLYKKNEDQIELLKAVYELFNYCEGYIILQMVSERRFSELIVERCRISDEIEKRLWDIFNTKRRELEKQIYFQRLVALDMKTNNLVNTNKEIQEELDYIEYLCFSFNNDSDTDVDWEDIKEKQQ